MNKSHLAVLSGFLVSFLFGLTFMFINTSLNYTTPIVMLSHRFTIAFITLTILIKMKVIKVDYKNKKLLPLIILALINPVINFLAEANSLRYITTIQVAVFLSLVPIAMLILSRIFLKEKTSKLQTTFILLSVTGVLVTIIDGITSQTSTSTIGIILAIVTIFTVAFHGLLTKRFGKNNYSANEITYVMITVGFIAFTLMAFITTPVEDIIVPLSSSKYLFSVSFLAIGASIIAYGLYNFMYTTISTAATSVFLNLTTVVSTVVGVLFLKETLSNVQVMGSILIIAGVVGTNIIEYKKGEQS